MSVIEAILNRKSIRYFKRYSIPEDDVKLLLECIRFAPSGGNRQPWEFLVVDDPEDINTIYDYGWTAYGGGYNVCRFDKASLLVFFLGGVECFFAPENLTLAAYGLGYGSCMIGGFDRARTKKLLDIPKEKRIRLFVAVGLADEERSNAALLTATGESVSAVLPYPPESRKPFTDIVFRGRYGNAFSESEMGITRAKIVGRFKSD
jgi:nitroreductase